MSSLKELAIKARDDFKVECRLAREQAERDQYEYDMSQLREVLERVLPAELYDRVIFSETEIEATVDGFRFGLNLNALSEEKAEFMHLQFIHPCQRCAEVMRVDVRSFADIGLALGMIDTGEFHHATCPHVPRWVPVEVEEPQKPRPKICPLLSVAYTQHVNCDPGRCAWWIDERGACVLALLWNHGVSRPADHPGWLQKEKQDA